MLNKLSLFKSWLLLLVLMVGSSAAWADEVTYTVTGKTTVSTSGTAPEGSSVSYSQTYNTAKQLTAGNSATLTVSGIPSNVTITGITLGVHNNASKGAGSATATMDGTEFATLSDISGLGNAAFVDKDMTVTSTTASGDLVITVSATVNSVYIETFKITYTVGSASTATLESITLSGNYPNSFTEGDAFSHNGMVVTATYDDTTTKDVSNSSSLSFTGYDMNTPGSQTVTVSYSEGSVTVTKTYGITVNALPTHTVTWSVNGTTTSDTFKEGAAITFPANPADIEGKTFVGWVATAISGTTNDAPNFVTSATMGTGDITYYAVFATKTQGSATATDDVLTAALIDQSVYGNWTGKTASSNAVYAGNSTTSQNGAIQIRTTNSNSGIVTTASGGKVTKIAVKWESTTADGRTLNIYGKNKAYSSAADLYSNSSTTQGTLLGTIVYGTSTELTISGDYEFIGMRSANNAMYLDKITITWTNGTPDTYSDYCTTVVADTHADAELAFSPDVVNFELGGTFVKPTLAAAAGFNGTVEYTSSNENVAQITDIETGDLVIVGEGTTIITATFAGDNTFKPSYASYTLNVTDNRIATTITQDNIVLDVSEVAQLTQLAPVVKDANDNVVAYDNTGALPEVYFNLDNDADGIIGSLDGNGAITLNSVIGTATITATYNHFNENATYKPSSCTFTITVESVLTIADARAQTTGDVTTKGVVTSVNGKTAYIQDATAAIVVFGTSNLTCVVGDKIKVSGTLTDYNGLLEIKDPTYTVLSQNNTVTPEVMTIADVNASTNQGWLVKIEDATVKTISDKNVTIEQSGEEIVVRFNATSDITFAVNDVITLTGNIGCYNTVQIANPTDVTVQQNTTPSIEVAQNSINADATGAYGTIEVTYNNITDVNGIADVMFFEADGTTDATYDYTWVNAVIDPNNDVNYTISANTGDARTAYMKVYALDDDGNDVYSELITVTQAKYVAPGTAAVYELYSGNLVEGDYIIYYDGKAMNTTVANDRLQYEEVTPTGNTIATDDATIVWHIAPSGSYWTIYNADANAYAASTGAKNKAQMLDDGTDDKALWTVSDSYEFVNKANSDAGVNANLRNNGTYGFACYATTTGGELSLYKKVTENVKVTAAGYATYCSDKALDFTNVTGLKAYKATVDTESKVTFTQVTKVPAGEGVLLEGAANTYTVPVIESAEPIENDLVGVLTATEVNAGCFVLLNQNNKVGFYKTTKTFTVSAHTAYLPALANSTRDFIWFGEDNTTGIEQMVNGKSVNGKYYNLQGQRVNKAQKGLYIVNGKKVVVK